MVDFSNPSVKDGIVSVEVEGIVDSTFSLLSLGEEGLSGWEEGKSSLLKDGKIGESWRMIEGVRWDE